jgi:hypothetical protein
MKDPVAVVAQHLLGGPLIEFQQWLIYFQDSIVSIINGQGVGKAFKNSQLKLVGF